MLEPAPAAWLLVALCTAAGSYCVLRMRSTVHEQRRAAGGDALMAFGMAVMALPAAVVTPPTWTLLLCAAVFAGAALHTAWSVRRDRHHLHHLVGALAMVYMAAAPAAGGGRMDGMAHGGAGTPVLTGVLLLYFAGHTLYAGSRLIPAPQATAGLGDAAGAADAGGGGVPAGTAPGPRLANRPELARACRLSMSIGMLAMLLAM